jgi:hypothetical protein
MGGFRIMQLPQSKVKQTYIEQIKIAEANLKEATSGNKDKSLLALVQKRLDSLAEKYQYSEEVGTARYKLYELQALVHYFNGHDDDALDFINQAIEMHGESYTKAEKLKEQLSLGDSYVSKTSDPSKMTKEQRRKQKIGLEGWLALFTVGIILSAIIYLLVAGLWIYNLGNLGNTADGFAAGLLSPYYSFLMITSFAMAILATWLSFLLFKWKRMARWVGIVLLSLSILISFIDYMWYANLMTQLSGLDPQRGSASAGWAIIWIIYLCVSKRVKKTLTK